MQIVRLIVDLSDVEAASDALWVAGPSAVGEATAGTGKVELTADISDVSLIPGDWPINVLEVDENASLDHWRDYARPEPAGDGFVIVPSWIPHATRGIGHRKPVLIDPGRSFGSGSHVTTRLCVGALERLVHPDDLVLDLGCGSGVLSIVAVLLGAEVVVAVDIDPSAVTATQSNADANAVEDQRIRVSATPIEDIDFRFDVVVANIGVRVLTESAQAIAAKVAPGGHLVLAGLLDDQLDQTVAAYPSFNEVERVSEIGWGVTTLLRPLPLTHRD